MGIICSFIRQQYATDHPTYIQQIQLDEKYSGWISKWTRKWDRELSINDVRSSCSDLLVSSEIWLLI